MRVLRFNEFLNESKKNQELELLNEGGAYGHLQHPFDNKTLSFADLEEMISITINGAFNPSNFVQEKTDGQNLMFTWKDGSLRAARNKGHIKNFGEKSLSKLEIEQMFAGRGEIQIAFTEAVEDLESAIKSLSPKQQEKIFANGKKFMSVEVIYPKTQNVVPYGHSMLVFHGTNEYDETGELIGQDKGEAKMLAGMIKQINADVQGTFFIRGPLDLKLEALPDTSKKESYYKAALSKVMKSVNLSSTNTISDYVTEWWTKYLDDNFKDYTPEAKAGLIKRLGHYDKSYAVKNMKADMTPEQIQKVKDFESKEHKKISKDCIRPLEHLFLELGADVLTNVNDFLTAIPKEATEKMRAEIQATINDIKSSDSVENIEKLEKELHRIEASGGLDRLVPTEGITFVYKGQLYKYTGLFAPINQLSGILKFG